MYFISIPHPYRDKFKVRLISPDFPLPTSQLNPATVLSLVHLHMLTQLVLRFNCYCIPAVSVETSPLQAKPALPAAVVQDQQISHSAPSCSPGPSWLHQPVS